ncbi:hypothetical protein OGAPHI_000384 [Ogataea philodendri]|uniref:Genetic interactor of prohibitin 5, mitochondrial n=1 Tax=Ogataea philodendri TaxID=1378263 RepID=A0A9P8PHW9_9ASCO|nr:uncharacterized protein OGAPHI_000384 [Ogataea philodendri]KAH3671679.1 hypothetical protein OGAPHI_000384 [Ogataea philodendri]
MELSKKRVVLDFHRRLGRRLRTLQLDSITDKRLRQYINKKFEKSSKSPKKSLKEGHEFYQLLVDSSRSQFKAGIQLFQIAYCRTVPPHKRVPDWLAEFLSTKVVTRDQKEQFKAKYEGILVHNHEINNFKNVKGLVEKYDKTMAQSDTESSPSNHSILDILKGKKPKSNPVQKPRTAFNSPYYARFDRLRSSFRRYIDHDWSLPQLNVRFPPNSVGLPRNPNVRQNLVLKKLLQLRRFIQEYPPIAKGDMDHLDNVIRSPSMDNHALRPAYERFLRDSYAINDDGSFKLSRTRSVGIPAPQELFKYYAK